MSNLLIPSGGKTILEELDPVVKTDGPRQEFKTTDEKSEATLAELLQELKLQNHYMSLVTGETVTPEDLDDRELSP